MVFSNETDPQLSVLTNIAEALAAHARVRPGATALTFLIDGEQETESLSFGELYWRAMGVARQIQERRPDAERALILQVPGLEFVVSLCACFLAGVAAVPTPLPAARVDSGSAKRFIRLARDAAPDVVLTHSAHLSRIGRVINVDAENSARTCIVTDSCDAIDEPFTEPAVTTSDLALVQYTSGSTGEPRGVLIDHGNLAANLAAIAGKFELTPESVVVNWLPPFHDMGLIGGILEAIWTGYHVVLMDPKHFIARPLRWMEAIHRFKADVSGGANFAYDLCADAIAKVDEAEFDLSRWRLAYSGAEPVRATSIERFSKAFAAFGFRQAAIYPCYGLAEATLMATGPNPGVERPVIEKFKAADLEKGRARLVGEQDTEDADVRSLVSCGTPCADTVIEIVDPKSGSVLEDNASGEIWIAGSAVFRGYHRDDAATTDVWRTLSHHPTRQFFASGDMGFRHQGELYVTGRFKDMMIFRGRNHFPSDIEDAMVVSHPMISPNGAAAFSVETGADEILILTCEIKREHRRNTDWVDVFRAVRASVMERSSVSPSDIVLLMPGALPRTTSGKLRRRACREAYLNGDWAVIARVADVQQTDDADALRPVRSFVTSGKDEKLAHVQDYLRWRLVELTSMPQAFLRNDAPLDTVGLDSLKQVELALLIEQDLGAALPADWMDQSTTTLDTLEVLIWDRMNANADATPVRPIAGTGQQVALSPMQRAFFEGAPSRPDEFLEVLYFRTPRGLDLAALEVALTALNEHHDAFALRFECNDDMWTCRYGDPAGNHNFQHIDVSKLQPTELAGVRGKILADLKSTISISKGPLVAAMVLDRGPDAQGMLVVAFHHLVVDAVSLSVWGTQFQEAYRKAKAGQAPMAGLPHAGFGAWLDALDVHGRSSVVSDELDYWSRVCGPASTTPDVPDFDHAGQPQALAQQSLDAVQNRALLEAFATPLERQALLLAAISRTALETEHKSAPLIGIESHGRHPFSGTEASRAIGWFVSQYPVRISAQIDDAPLSDYAHALQSLQAVPNLGIGYGLLRARPQSDPDRIAMESLARPDVFFQYRGNIDDTFRKGATLPVIGIHHAGEPYLESQRRRGELQSLSIMAGLNKGSLFWTVVYTEPARESQAKLFNDGIYRFLTQMVRSLIEVP